MTTFSVLPVIADIVVPSTPPPRPVPPYLTIGVWPFVLLAMVAVVVLIFSRKSRPPKSVAAVPAEKS
jgi:hypothetical protein